MSCPALSSVKRAKRSVINKIIRVISCQKSSRLFGTPSAAIVGQVDGGKDDSIPKSG